MANTISINNDTYNCADNIFEFYCKLKKQLQIAKTLSVELSDKWNNVRSAYFDAHPKTTIPNIPLDEIDLPIQGKVSNYAGQGNVLKLLDGEGNVILSATLTIQGDASLEVIAQKIWEFGGNVIDMVKEVESLKISNKRLETKISYLEDRI